MAKRITYKAPRNAAERIAEAQAAIRRLEASMNSNIAMRVGQTGQNHRESIARWQTVIDREAGK